MENLEEKLGSILKDPDLMQQIMTMAQNLGGSEPPPTQVPQEHSAPPQDQPPMLDPAMLKGLTSMMRQTGIDGQQRALLAALTPYLSGWRVRKLENAMRASKLAGFAAMALRQKGG